MDDGDPELRIAFADVLEDAFVPEVAVATRAQGGKQSACIY